MGIRGIINVVIGAPSVLVILAEIIFRMTFKGKEDAKKYMFILIGCLIRGEEEADQITRNGKIYGILIWSLIITVIS